MNSPNSHPGGSVNTAHAGFTPRWCLMDHLGSIAYYRGEYALAGASMMQAAEDIQEETGKRPWRMLRRAANSLMWAGHTAKAQALLLEIAAQNPGSTPSDVCFYAMTDLFFIGIDQLSFPLLSQLRDDLSTFTRDHGCETWNCRLDLLDAMLAWRRGDAVSALPLACSGRAHALKADITTYCSDAYLKWASIACFSLQDKPALLAWSHYGDNAPSYVSISSIREDYAQILAARIVRADEGGDEDLLRRVRSLLERLHVLGGVWDERYQAMRALLVMGECREFRYWHEKIPMIDPWAGRLLHLDLLIAEKLAQQDLKMPDWELQPDAPRKSGFPAHTEALADVPRVEGASELHHTLQSVFALASAEDHRLGCSIHTAEALQRLNHLRSLKLLG